VLLASCAHEDRTTLIRVSVPNQKMLVFKKGVHTATYDCSTSKFGLGDQPGSRCTPLGRMKIAAKIGGNQPSGMKFKDRRPTGEIVRPDAPGRDPIVSRILWLKGLEGQNRNAFGRTIYIHGTAEERTIGSRASYGCIRMRSRDVIALYGQVGVGAIVEVTPLPFPEPVLASSPTAPAKAGRIPVPPPTPPAQSVGAVSKVAPRG
jgi:hypothetical protein